MIIAVCDDYIKELNEVVEYCSNILSAKDTILSYDNPTKLLDDLELKSISVDIFILDIEMPELSGITLKDIIAKKYVKSIIIFLTSHDEMMEEAFGRNVVAFIRKDNWKAKLKETIVRVKDEEKTIWIDSKKECFEIKLKNIISFNAADYYSIVYFINEDSNNEKSSVILKKSLRCWETDISDDRFCRISKSAIVNFENIKNFVGDTITMVDETRYIIPKGKIKKIRDKYYKYVKEYGWIL